MTELDPHPVSPVRQIVRGPLLEVWRGEDARGEAHRLEILRTELCDDAAICARVRETLGRLPSLVHPGIGRYRGIERLADGRLCARLDHIEGETLDQILQTTGPLAPRSVLAFAESLGDAADFLRLNGVIHGAIGPWSIVLAASGARLTQFGGAGLLGPDAPRETAEILAGLPGSAPELKRGAAAGADTDLYAIAAVLFEALTGVPPAAQDDPGTTLAVYLEAAAPELRAEVAAVGRTLLRALSDDPSERFATGAALARAMRNALEDPSFDRTMLSGEQPPSPSANTESPGELFGNYELISLLGEGGMGRVFKARHTRLGRLVALKVLKPEHAQNRGLVQRFFDEARAVNQIDHEHIVDIHDFVEDVSVDPPRVYCVMELLEGESLADRMVRAPLPVTAAVDIIRQVCSALQAAHTVGVYHRDIKPDNVFLAQRGGARDFVKVLDFGVAKLAPSIAGARGATVAGTIVGTPVYMSPEQASGYEIDGRSDLYTVGGVLYQLLTGRLPFDGNTFLDIAVKVTTLPPPPLGPVTPSGEPIPPKLAELVMSCLSKEPSGRPASMTELSTLLAPFATPGALRFPWSMPPTLPEELPASIDPLHAVATSAPPSINIPPPPVPGYTPPQLEASSEERRAETPTSPPSLELAPEELEVLPNRRRPAIVALALAALLTAVGAVFLANRSRPADTPLTTSEPAAPEPEVNATEETIAATASPPELPPSVELKIVSQPAGAVVVRRDTGEQLGTTPLSISTERSAEAPMPVRLELTGYTTLETQLPRDQDRVLEVVLSAVPRPKAVIKRAAPKPRAIEKPAEPASRALQLSRDGVLDAYED